jgi:hypothetical protein
LAREFPEVLSAIGQALLVLWLYRRFVR